MPHFKTPPPPPLRPSLYTPNPQSKAALSARRIQFSFLSATLESSYLSSSCCSITTVLFVPSCRELWFFSHKPLMSHQAPDDWSCSWRRPGGDLQHTKKKSHVKHIYQVACSDSIIFNDCKQFYVTYVYSAASVMWQTWFIHDNYRAFSVFVHWCSECYLDSSESLLTRPRLLSGQSEAVTLRVGVTDVRRLFDAVHRQHAALLAVGRPAAVLHVPRGPHASHHGVI